MLSVVAGLLGGTALLDFALALERQNQSACFGTLALPSAAVDPESQSFFAAPRNQMVSCPDILPPSCSWAFRLSLPAAVAESAHMHLHAHADESLMQLQACTEWFVRLRPSLLKLSAGLAHHSAIAYNGLKHLELLPRQIEAALAPAAVPRPSTAQQAISAGITAGQNAASPNAATQKQPRSAKGQQRQAVPVKPPDPPRILRRSTASIEGESALGSVQPGMPARQPTQPEEQRSPAGQVSRSPESEKARAPPLTAKEKLLQEVMDTLWMTCSALAELAQPDDIAGLHPIASSAFFKLSSATLRQAS